MLVAFMSAAVEDSIGAFGSTATERIATALKTSAWNACDECGLATELPAVFLRQLRAQLDDSWLGEGGVEAADRAMQPFLETAFNPIEVAHDDVYGIVLMRLTSARCSVSDVRRTVGRRNTPLSFGTTHVEAKTLRPTDELPAIHLSIHPESLTPLSFWSLPYVLMHEYVCHLTEARETAPNAKRPQEFLWVEGWMDEAALLVHNMGFLLDGCDSPYGRRAGRVTLAAEQRRIQRFSFQTHGAQRKRGAQHARDARALLRRKSQRIDDDQFVRFSLEANSQVNSHQTLGLFTTVLPRLLDGAAADDVVTAFDAWASGGESASSVVRLVNELHLLYVSLDT